MNMLQLINFQKIKMDLFFRLSRFLSTVPYAVVLIVVVIVNIMVPFHDRYRMYYLIQISENQAFLTLEGISYGQHPANS